MSVRLLTLAVVVLLVGACRSTPVVEQRSTQGPMAEEIWIFNVVTANGREPTFDERRHWNNQIDEKISKYLREHPDAANSLEVSTFRFMRQVTVGMSKEQVLILLGPPVSQTSDQAEIEKLARKYWAQIQGNATEAWVYGLGWHLFFAGPRVVDITQYRER